MYLDSIASSVSAPKQQEKTNLKTDKKFTTTTMEQKIPPNVSSSKRITGRWVMVPTGINRVKVMNIMYAHDSTLENPIMCDEYGEHRVAINDIDPRKASELEMQMYCANLDATGQGTGSTFGTYNDLRTVKMAAKYSNGGGLSTMVPSFYQRVHDQYNWIEITESYMNIVKRNDPKQYTYIKRLFDALSAATS